MSSSEPRSGAVIVASTSAAAGVALDTTGPVIARWLNDYGYHTGTPHVVADGTEVGQALKAALVGTPSVIITTGGTGVSPDDTTPEETVVLLDIQIPGIIEEIRRRGVGVTPIAILTRGVAGFAGNTLIVNLPGSPGGVDDGLAVLAPVLDHLVQQRTGRKGHSGRANHS
ncbi:MogA/MoaB family molybdenum cofactor biosynthesis protein [Leucobacter sp. Z1108]|uniref:MogA/MoaB family molybdenum cofactor biosynthesis protein n=1 Tax=unclassified Leucobacter TaxID=2621730 RepID=UPI003D95F490